MKVNMQSIGSIMKDRGGVERYRGFTKPNTTPTPDDVFDVFLATLSPAELRVLLYIVRRTFGFKKDSDRISLKQIAEGIMTKQGRRLDSGTGLSRRGAIKAVKGLEAKGLIDVKRLKTGDGYNLVNVYSLRFREG